MQGRRRFQSLQKAFYAEAPSDPLAVFEEMARKHPPARQHMDLTRLGTSRSGLAPSVDAEAITAALKSFNKHSGAGPSGLRPFHLRQALVPAYADQVVDHLVGLVNVLVRGEAHTDVSPWLCGALLMALPKKDGSCRPIAVGEVLRRLAAKTLCAAYQEQARNYLWPLQIGVAQPLGTEIGLQVAHQWCYRRNLIWCSSSWISLTLSTPLTGSVPSARFGVECLAWPRGSTIATPAPPS